MNALPPYRPRTPAAFTDLPFGGQLTLWAVRVWTVAHGGCPGAHDTLRTAFRLVGLPAAHVALHTFLSIARDGGTRDFVVQPPDAHPLSGDEQLFLALLHDHQRAAAISAYQALSVLIVPANMRSAMAASLEYCSLLDGRGLFILRSSFDEDRQPVHPAAAGTDCTVH